MSNMYDYRESLESYKLTKQICDKFTPLNGESKWDKNPYVLIGKTIKHVLIEDNTALFITDKNEYLRLEVSLGSCGDSAEIKIDNDGITVNELHAAGAVTAEEFQLINDAFKKEDRERQEQWDIAQLKKLKEKYPDA